MAFDPAAYLKETGSVADADIDLARVSVALAAAGQPGISVDRYLNHFKKLADETATRHAEFLAAGGEDDAATRLASMKRAIVEDNGYKGDVDTYEDLQNASIIRVIERRVGLPISLAIFYIHVGQALGWEVCGLDFPGHFLARVEKDGRRIIFDPFYDCRVLEAAELRALVKHIRGPQAELSATYFEAASNRAVLIRLQNNIKYRLIEAEDYEGALKIVELMRLMAPDEFRLLLDAGVLYARTDAPDKAIAALEDYIKKAPRHSDRHDAAVMLQELKDAPPKKP